jgi:hypothetical protein
MSEPPSAEITRAQKLLCEALQRRYGEILTLAELGEVLRFPSHQATCKARRQGRIPLRMFQVPHRRGWFATAADVATYMSSFAADGAGEGSA